MFNKPDMRSCGFSSNPHENVATTHLPFKRGPQKKYPDENTKAQITNHSTGRKAQQASSKCHKYQARST